MSRTFDVLRKAAFAILALLLTACSAMAAPRPAAERTPAIEHPLDATGVVACEISIEPALSASNVDPSSAADGSDDRATSCVWRSQDNADSVQIALSTDFAIQRIVDALRTVQGPSSFSIKGYPSVREGDADSTICTIYTAVADTQVFSVQVGSRAQRATKPCQSAELLAGAVIDALLERSR